MHVLFFISGISGLIYQIIWVRQFGNLFGNTIQSASLITAVFMLGLGVGSYLIGRKTDSSEIDSEQSIRLYSYFELGIGFLGLFIALAFPYLEPLSAKLSVYAIGKQGWQELTWQSSMFRYAVATLIVFPSTFLMGGTLPLLIRWVLKQDMSDAADKVGRLYGINTLGAACGAFLADCFLIPTTGLFATQILGALLNILAGLSALNLLSQRQRLSSATDSIPDSINESSAPSSEPGKILRYWQIYLALFAAGLFGMGLEIVWFRFLSGIQGQHRMVFSLLLFSILVGFWFGARIGGWLIRRGLTPTLIFIGAQLTSLIASFVFLILFRPEWNDSALLKDIFFLLPDWLHFPFEALYVLRAIVFVTLIPSVFMGIGFPIANQLVQDLKKDIGSRAGGLYLANTAGGVLGSLLTGLLFLPVLGMKNTIAVLSLVAFFGILPLTLESRFHSAPSPRRLWRQGWLLAATAVCWAWWALPTEYLRDKIFFKAEDRKNIVLMSEGLNEILAISRGKDDRLVLFTNGHKMSGTELGDQRYMGAFVHIPMMQIRDPKAVLVICFGVGNTLHAASLYPSLENLEIVDLSKNILGHADFFKKWNEGVLNDPRVNVFINDGRQHLRMTSEEKYDLITLEPPPIVYAGVSSLYSKEFYELAKSRLKPGAYMTQWFPINQLPAEEGLALVRAFIDVFPDSVLLNGHHNTLMLMGRKNQSIEFDPQLALDLMNERSKATQNMRDVALESVLELAGSFVATYQDMKSATEFVNPVTDDWPVIEYAHLAVMNHRIEPNLFRVTHVFDWCPKCRILGQPGEELEYLTTYLGIVNAWYNTRQYMEYSNSRIIAKEQIDIPKFVGDVPAVISRSKYLSMIFGGQIQ